MFARTTGTCVASRVKPVVVVPSPQFTLPASGIKTESESEVCPELKKLEEFARTFTVFGLP